METFDSRIVWERASSLKRGLIYDRSSRAAPVKELTNGLCFGQAGTGSTHSTPPSPHVVPNTTDGQNPQASPAVYVADAYRLRAIGLRKIGDSATMALMLEATVDRPSRFLMGDCYALDENGVRWEQKDRYENRFTWGYGNDLLPNTRQRIDMKFATTNSTTGSVFTLSCTESQPQSGRHIIVYNIIAR